MTPIRGLAHGIFSETRLHIPQSSIELASVTSTEPIILPYCPFLELTRSRSSVVQQSRGKTTARAPTSTR